MVVKALAVMHCPKEAGRVAPRIGDVAAGKVEGKAQTERNTFTRFRKPLFHFRRGEQVQATHPIHFAELAPVRPFRALDPTLCHLVSLNFDDWQRIGARPALSQSRSSS